VTSEGNYKNNDEEGEWKEYDRDGKLVKKVLSSTLPQS
jgi:antitoxin component YwqK of YwqJK toxin-antitoxin module